jgi:hypothetical protein
MATAQILHLRVVSLITAQLAVEVGLQTFPALSRDTYRTRDNSTRFRIVVATLFNYLFSNTSRYADKIVFSIQLIALHNANTMRVEF